MFDSTPAVLIRVPQPRPLPSSTCRLPPPPLPPQMRSLLGNGAPFMVRVNSHSCGPSVHGGGRDGRAMRDGDATGKGVAVSCVQK